MKKIKWKLKKKPQSSKKLSPSLLLKLKLSPNPFTDPEIIITPLI